MRMKNQVVAVAIALFLGTVAFQTSAQADFSVLTNLNLTADQQSNITAIITAAMPKLRPLVVNAITQEHALRVLITQGATDSRIKDSRILSAAGKFAAADAKLIKASIGIANQIYKGVLTADQRVIVDEALDYLDTILNGLIVQAGLNSP